LTFGIETFELGFLRGIQDAIGCSFMDALMTFFSALGNYGAIWVVCGVAMLFSGKYRVHGIMLFAGLCVGLLFGNLLMKTVIGRPRPCWLFETGEMLVDIPKDFSFPSGHTLSSFIGAFVLLDANWKFGAPALALAMMIAFSRLYLFVHFPTDILGGIFLALLIAMGVKYIMELAVKTEFFKSKNKQKE